VVLPAWRLLAVLLLVGAAGAAAAGGAWVLQDPRLHMELLGAGAAAVCFGAAGSDGTVLATRSTLSQLLLLLLPGAACAVALLLGWDTDAGCEGALGCSLPVSDAVRDKPRNSATCLCVLKVRPQGL
jgi:hypothetical protein